MPSDLGERRSKHTDVIDAQTGDSGDCWCRNNVCAVIGATDAALDDCSIHALGLEGVEGHQGQETEVYRLRRGRLGVVSGVGGRLLQAIPRLEEVLCELIFRQRRSIDLYPFPYKAQMRRRIEANLIGLPGQLRRPAKLVEHRGDEGGRRPLALCAGDVNSIERIQVSGLVNPNLLAFALYV